MVPEPGWRVAAPGGTFPGATGNNAGCPDSGDTGLSRAVGGHSGSGFAATRLGGPVEHSRYCRGQLELEVTVRGADRGSGARLQSTEQGVRPRLNPASSLTSDS